MKTMKLLATLALLTIVATVDAQSIRLYKFCDVTHGHREPYATTRTLKTYPVGYTYREGATEPKLTFTPYKNKWYYLQEIKGGDTISTYIKRANIFISEYKTANLPDKYIGQQFFGDGTTIRIIDLDLAGHQIEGLQRPHYVMEVNVGYYTSTYPLLRDGESFRLDETGATQIVVDNIYNNIIDSRGRLKWNARCVENTEKPIIFYLPEQKAIYYNGKFLHPKK